MIRELRGGCFDVFLYHINTFETMHYLLGTKLITTQYKYISEGTIQKRIDYN